jgi:hypothetical protein
MAGFLRRWCLLVVDGDGDESVGTKREGAWWGMTNFGLGRASNGAHHEAGEAAAFWPNSCVAA